ncbi:MAG: knotted carbamoyltransferase YgeW [Bacteroidales bacterium]|nr:knotted carbamoyltransferase YgeW [Bacteroidales bacterium]MCF8404719.1 knotted carbamoyltransferase YgeW [Bacteroidales bacterium]
MTDFQKQIENLTRQNNELFSKDFLLTWEKNKKDLNYILELAQLLKDFRDNNISTKMFDSGLAVSIFRDQSTRTRFSFASAANLLGLEVQDMDESKSQIAHGETVRETANMISFLTDVIGIRDDIFLGEGNKYMREVGEALDDGFQQEVLPQRPGIVNLQCDMDHPTQSLADLLHLKNHFGSLENLKGKKIAMTWAYSPSYGKPLSVPQGIISLMTRFGMDVSLAYPEGYNLIPELEQQAASFAKQNNTKFEINNSMDEAFQDADIVYPKSWAPFSVMQQRTLLLQNKDAEGLKALEKSCLVQNANFTNWECDEEKMKLTKNGEALYMHCLPADITDVSCKQGEVSEKVFEKYRIDTYKEAGYKPYIIAAMMMSNRFDDPGETLGKLFEKDKKRVFL